VALSAASAVAGTPTLTTTPSGPASGVDSCRVVQDCSGPNDTLQCQTNNALCDRVREDITSDQTTNLGGLSSRSLSGQLGPYALTGFDTGRTVNLSRSTLNVCALALAECSINSGELGACTVLQSCQQIGITPGDALTRLAQGLGLDTNAQAAIRNVTADLSSGEGKSSIDLLLTGTE